MEDGSKKVAFLTRPTPARKTHRSLGKATAGEKSRRTLRYDELQNDARSRQGERRALSNEIILADSGGQVKQLPWSGE